MSKTYTQTTTLPQGYQEVSGNGFLNILINAIRVGGSKSRLPFHPHDKARLVELNRHYIDEVDQKLDNVYVSTVVANTSLISRAEECLIDYATAYLALSSGKTIINNQERFLLPVGDKVERKVVSVSVIYKIREHRSENWSEDSLDYKIDTIDSSKGVEVKAVHAVRSRVTVDIRITGIPTVSSHAINRSFRGVNLKAFFEGGGLHGDWKYDEKISAHICQKFEGITIQSEWMPCNGEDAYISLYDDQNNALVIACVIDAKKGVKHVKLHMMAIVTVKDSNFRFVSRPRSNVGDLSIFYMSYKGQTVTLPKSLAPCFHDICQITGFMQNSAPFKFIINRSKISITADPKGRHFSFLTNKLLCRIGEVGLPSNETPISELDYAVDYLCNELINYTNHFDPFKLIRHLLTSTLSIDPFVDQEIEIGKYIATDDDSALDIRDFLSHCRITHPDGKYTYERNGKQILTVGDLWKIISPLRSIDIKILIWMWTVGSHYGKPRQDLLLDDVNIATGPHTTMKRSIMAHVPTAWGFKSPYLNEPIFIHSPAYNNRFDDISLLGREFIVKHYQMQFTDHLIKAINKNGVIPIFSKVKDGEKRAFQVDDPSLPRYLEVHDSKSMSGNPIKKLSLPPSKINGQLADCFGGYSIYTLSQILCSYCTAPFKLKVTPKEMKDGKDIADHSEDGFAYAFGAFMNTLNQALNIPGREYKLPLRSHFRYKFKSGLTVPESDSKWLVLFEDKWWSADLLISDFARVISEENRVIGEVLCFRTSYIFLVGAKTANGKAITMPLFRTKSSTPVNTDREVPIKQGGKPIKVRLGGDVMLFPDIFLWTESLQSQDLA